MNLRPLRPERSALPNCAISRNSYQHAWYYIIIVGSCQEFRMKIIKIPKKFLRIFLIIYLPLLSGGKIEVKVNSYKPIYILFTIFPLSFTIDPSGYTPLNEFKGYTEVFLPITVPGFKTQPHPISA